MEPLVGTQAAPVPGCGWVGGRGPQPTVPLCLPGPCSHRVPPWCPGRLCVGTGREVGGWLGLRRSRAAMGEAGQWWVFRPSRHQAGAGPTFPLLSPPPGQGNPASKEATCVPAPYGTPSPPAAGDPCGPGSQAHSGQGPGTDRADWLNNRRCLRFPARPTASAAPSRGAVRAGWRSPLSPPSPLPAMTNASPKQCHRPSPTCPVSRASISPGRAVMYGPGRQFANLMGRQGGAWAWLPRSLSARLRLRHPHLPHPPRPPLAEQMVRRPDSISEAR